MAKKAVTAVPITVEEKRPSYAGYEMSATSEYYIYGRGNAEDYARSVCGIKEELRKSAYEEKRQEPVVILEEEPKVEKKAKKSNGFAGWIAVFSLLSLVVFFFQSVVKDFTLKENVHFTLDGVGIIKLLIDGFGCIGQMEFGRDGYTFISLICVTAVALTNVILFIAGLARCRSAKVGGFIKTVGIIELLFAIGLVVAATMAGMSVATGMVIMTIIAVINVALAFGGRKDKKGGKRNA